MPVTRYESKVAIFVELLCNAKELKETKVL